MPHVPTQGHDPVERGDLLTREIAHVSIPIRAVFETGPPAYMKPALERLFEASVALDPIRVIGGTPGGLRRRVIYEVLGTIAGEARSGRSQGRGSCRSR